jgi:NAD(P)-dependent dehydrogenase (short-subunit alcohol dehydrogenase family)
LLVAKRQGCNSHWCHQGLGFELSKEFAKTGGIVIVCPSIERAEKSVTLIKGKAYPKKLDATNVQGITEFIRDMTERCKHIDILINNAGYAFDSIMWNKRFHEAPEDDRERVIEVDLRGSFRLSRLGPPFMIKNGSGSRGGRGVISNIASTPAIEPHIACAGYSIAKSGIITITILIALEYGDTNNRAYALAPGNISTDATFSSTTLTERKRAAMENSMKRLGHPREVATIAVSFASKDFAFATGNMIFIDDGMVML